MKSLKLSIRCMKTPISNQQGFSLMEMVIVVIFLGVSLTAITNLYITLSRDSTNLYLMSQATVLAEGKLEDIMSDRNMPNRGYSFVIEKGRYPKEKFGDFTITTNIESDGHEYNGVPYVLVIIKVSHPSLDDIKVAVWITKG